MAFPYKCVLLIGATAGIGRAMGDRLVKGGSKVIAVGRRKERLEEFVSQHGSEMAYAEPFDVTNREQIPRFAAE
jgi:NADP-dependent 3-hydroxy acid dehydrogenase YdfG